MSRVLAILFRGGKIEILIAGQPVEYEVDSSLIDYDMDRPFNSTPQVNANDVCELFSASKVDAYVMGGAVRNWLIGEHARDIDIVVTCPIQTALDKVSGISEAIEIKPKLDFGLIYLIGDLGDIDVNSLRDCDDIQGKSDIDSVIFKCGKSLEVDAQIRDFTINAFYMNSENRRIINHFPTALDDLEARIIRLIMDERKLAIDYRTTIRILQFMARDYRPTDYTLSVLRERLDADIIAHDRYGDWLAFHVPPHSKDRDAFRKLAFEFAKDRRAIARLDKWFGDAGRA